MKIHPKSCWMWVPILLSLSACAPVSGILAQSTVGRDLNPSIPQNNLAILVDGNNAFAMDLYQVLDKQDGNLILSPYSISLALAMTYAGARAQTESQMATSMHFTLPQDQLHPAFNQLALKLQQPGKSPSADQQPLQLNIANGVWAQQDHPFQQAFLDLISRNYGAGIHLADFIKNSEAARNEINGWVGDQTKGKIQNLIPPDALDIYTRMVLVNAIYFKANWQNQFDPNSTQKSEFKLLDGTQVKADMMSETMNSVLYTRRNGLQAIELTYQGGTAAMDIILPDPGNFKNVETTLDSQKLNAILSSLRTSAVALELPKFTYASQFSLADALKTLGLIGAFDSNAADFSGMDGQRDLFIGAVFHKAYVAVDEKGTEAAAATAVILQSSAAPLQEPIHLAIDRPFIFVIRDTNTGQLLFIGRVMNPIQ